MECINHTRQLKRPFSYYIITTSDPKTPDTVID